jgi:Asp-tRNA(Asn)/Glu-tRNA(Gln) amidotransferase C subunit
MTQENLSELVRIARKEFDREETSTRQAQIIINALSELSYYFYTKGDIELAQVISFEVAEMRKDVEFIERS